MRHLNDIPEPVQWYEGMLLAPQHFQQAWQRSEALMGYTLMQGCFFPWGVRRLSLDRGMLAAGTVRVLALEAVMPDGLAVLHPHEDEPYLRLDLTPHKREMSEQPMALHLCIPADNPHPEPGDMARWSSVEGESITDANTRDNALTVARLRPALSLQLTEGPETPPPNRYVSMPLASIRFQEDAFVLSDYAPPRPDFPNDGPLAKLCRDVVQKMREKAQSLADRIQGNGEIPSGNMADTLRALTAGLPRLEALIQVPEVHPFMVYLSLCNLTGALSWLGQQAVPPTPPPYAHINPLPGFQTLCTYIGNALELVRVGYLTRRFHRDGDNHFSYPLPDQAMPESLVIGARVPPSCAPADIALWLRHALICSDSKLDSIAERRIRGAARVRIEEAREMQLRPQAGLVLERVTAEPEFLVPGEKLHITGGGSGREPDDILLFEAQSPAGAEASGGSS